MISPVAAWMTRMSRSWMSRMTGVPSRVRPMPMWWRWPLMAEGDVAGVVDAVVADAELAVGVVGAGGGFGAGGVGGGGGGVVWE